jgi:DNA-binding transcriptional LysR family regulator
MRRRYLSVRLELVTDGRLVDIVSEGFDAGVRYAGTVPRDMVAVPCGPDSRIAIVASPSYFKHRAPPSRPEDLA